MKHVEKEMGPQYSEDDAFKTVARRHQSKYRSEVLAVDFDKYGNRLREVEGKELLNYYPGLGCRHELRTRYPNYSKTRDADMLRSEHIPFNMFAPMKQNDDLAQRVIEKAFKVKTASPHDIRIEWAPSPKDNYLDDATSFDTYIQCKGALGQTIGIGIEVKYTEKGYRIGEGEKLKIKDPNSTYWNVARDSGVFNNAEDSSVTTDDLRQVWRNHLLGLAMLQRHELDEFYSITLYPMGNHHFDTALRKYCSLLKPTNSFVWGCTFEDFIASIDGGTEILQWKKWLTARYIVKKQPQCY